MPIGILFWVLMIIWAIYGFAWNSAPSRFGNWGWLGNGLLIFVLLALLGWHDFGPILQNGAAGAGRY